jgi:hypothetical protein
MLPAIMAPAANSKIPLVITSLITPVRGAAERHFEIWSALYRAGLWRHKVNPATPGEINARCDKKVA